MKISEVVISQFTKIRLKKLLRIENNKENKKRMIICEIINFNKFFLLTFLYLNVYFEFKKYEIKAPTPNPRDPEMKLFKPNNLIAQKIVIKLQRLFNIPTNINFINLNFIF